MIDSQISSNSYTFLSYICVKQVVNSIYMCAFDKHILWKRKKKDSIYCVLTEEYICIMYYPLINLKKMVTKK